MDSIIWPVRPKLVASSRIIIKYYIVISEGVRIQFILLIMPGTFSMWAFFAIQKKINSDTSYCGT